MRNLVLLLQFALAISSAISLNSCKHEPDAIPISNPANPGDSNNLQITCSPDTTYFQNDIMPILATSCAYSSCHDSDNPQEGIDLTTYESIIASGAIVPGNASESELYEVITESDPEDRMPYGLPPLSQEQISAIRNWISQGARNNRCYAECDTTLFTFSGVIKPIIDQNCVGCHNATNTSGGVRLDSHQAIASVAADGRLIGVITHAAGYIPMPYSSNPANQRKLDDCKIIQIQKWVTAGSPE